MEWSRGEVVGRGSFATVSLASVRRCDPDGRSFLPPLVAVKSAPLSDSAILSHEESVLAELAGCPHLVRCLGHDVTADPATGAASYDLFLEYAAGGTLRDALRRSGGSLPEPAVRRYARSILLALRHVHARGYAHCDVKLENVLLLLEDGAAAKLADFGLAKRVNYSGGAGIRGTPLYMSPEAVARGEYGAAADVWSLGCAVAEMATGRPAWGRPSDCGGGAAWGLLFKIGFGDESPEIPAELSEEGKDFLRRCFVKDPARRWTAEMLLRHPFVALEEDAAGDSAIVDGDRCSSASSSPRSVLGLTQWLSPRSQSSSICSSSLTESVADPDSSPATDRIGELATTDSPNWFSSSSSIDGWLDVRMISEIDSELGEELMLEEMVGGDGSREVTILESDQDQSCSTVTKFQHSSQNLATKHDDSTNCSLEQTGDDLNRFYFYSLTVKECKKVETTLNRHKHKEF